MALQSFITCIMICIITCISEYRTDEEFRSTFKMRRYALGVIIFGLLSVLGTIWNENDWIITTVNLALIQMIIYEDIESRTIAVRYPLGIIGINILYCVCNTIKIANIEIGAIAIIVACIVLNVINQLGVGDTLFIIGGALYMKIVGIREVYGLVCMIIVASLVHIIACIIKREKRLAFTPSLCIGLVIAVGLRAINIALI